MVEDVISNITSRMKDVDLARLFENAFPNTLDTTVRWHREADKRVPGTTKANKPWMGAQSFIVTGDINAEWLRDSTNQLLQYQPLAKEDEALRTLILGAINTQAEYVIASPYCNAFQPPPSSNIAPSYNGQHDIVHPGYEPSQVFECKYELDSLAHFLALGNQFFKSTGSAEFITPRWMSALATVIDVLKRQSHSTFNPDTGTVVNNEYTFQRHTTAGTETLSLSGLGNPLNWGTGLIRSAFRPSDDATILGYLIPSNAMMAVELQRTADMLEKHGDQANADYLRTGGKALEDAVWQHGVVKHEKWGDVFAFEVDGYGSRIMMDDSNLPSLLALPLLGFVDRKHQVYQNTRKMVLSKEGNPYFLTGKTFRGIGGPHIGLRHAWPMSVLVQAMTSDDEEEIEECLAMVLKHSHLGLVNESVNVERKGQYTRSWFAWANSVFAQAILDLAGRKPGLIFKTDEPYVIGEVKKAEQQGTEP